jgi:hypothetical protein
VDGQSLGFLIWVRKIFILIGFQTIVYSICAGEEVIFKKIKTVVKIRQFSDFPKLKPRE